MIALRPSVFAAAALTTGSPSAQANPAMSEQSDVTNHDQDSCVQFAQGSFVNGGWRHVNTSGYLITADRGALSGMIVCLYDSFTQSVAVVVVSGGNGNASDAAADSLFNQMQTP